MIQCNLCGKKLVTPAQMEKHMAVSHPVTPTTVEPIEVPQPVVEPIKERIILRFKVPVQVSINGNRYPQVDGKVIEVDSMEIATEIVRIVREAYGDVIER